MAASLSTSESAFFGPVLLPRARIASVGFSLPKKVIDNDYLATLMSTSDDFIVTRTGLRERRHVTPSVPTSELMVEAGARAIERARLSPADIDLMIVSTLSPDHHDPSQANLIQPKLGLRHIPCFDIRAQCSGFLYGIEIGAQYIQTRRCRNVLVISGEVLSKRMDCSNDGRNLAVLLADGAGAAVLQASNDVGVGLIDQVTGADGSHFRDLWTEAPGTAHETFLPPELMTRGAHQFRMQGRQLFEHAVEAMVSCAKELLARNHLSVSDLDLVIPHQPNPRILERVNQLLEIPEGKLLMTNHLGNMGSASLPVVLGMSIDEGRVRPGTLCMLLAYGAGSTWSAAIHRF
ncbi:beta-ketoacyl-ACP synthase 3 [Pendulispora brunnea]|uniref:Beta-ketoacyl-ACP synthase 3 n=1 Tax=Pendulispora brunnea TaxID=2905690 RepID=A0ABZ2KDG2_9BACT